MKVFSSLIPACLLLLSGLSSYAAIDTSTQIFNPNFRTLKVMKENQFLQPPVITLNSDERIVISFDEIGDDYSYLRFRLIHCNADWQPSALVESEYLDGFNYCDIEDYAFSSNTFIHYVNYRLTVPSEGMKPLVSGNYLLQVFPQDDPDDTILQARFYVSEDAVNISGSASGRTDKGFNTEWQQLDLNLNSGNFPISNPYQDVTLQIEQNSRPDALRVITHPMRVDGRNLVYQHQPELIYPASNEFRRFETVRTDYPGMHVDSTRYIGENYHAFLAQDYARDESNYSYDQTQFGRFLVREYNASDSDLGADYVTVHFSLDFPELLDGDIYVDGEFTNHRYDDAFRMQFDPESRLYFLELPLKQGSYNYQYVAVPRKEAGNKTRNGARIGQAALVEGNKYETRNEYFVRAYYRQPGQRADRLIGSSVIISHDR